MAVFYGLPPEVPVGIDDPFESAGPGALSLKRVAQGIGRSLDAGGGPADPRLERFHRAWPRLESLERYLAVGNTEFAERVAKDLQAEFPELPAAHFGVGAARAGRGDWDGAAAEFARARRMAPGNRRITSELYLALGLGGSFAEAEALAGDLAASPEGRRLLALFGPRVAAADAAGLARLVAALGGLSRARASGDAAALSGAARDMVSAFPDEVPALTHAAEALRDAGERGPALALAERMTRQGPGHAPGWLLLASLALEAGDRPGAERAALRARAADPDDPRGVELLARVLRADGRPGQAARLLESVQERFPGEPRLSALYAGALLESLDTGRAVRHLEAEAERRPYDPLARYNLARALEAAGRLDDAAAAYRDALSRAPRFPECLEALALCLDRLGRRDEARALLDRLVADLPESPYGWRGLGDLQLSTDIGEAARAYARAVELRPDLPAAGALFIAALTESRAGHADRALELFEKAVRTDPRRHEAWCGLGAALFAAGNLAGAERAFAEAVRQNDRVPGYRRNLAAVHRALFRGNPLRHWRALGRARREEREAARLPDPTGAPR